MAIINFLNEEELLPPVIKTGFLGRQVDARLPKKEGRAGEARAETFVFNSRKLFRGILSGGEIRRSCDKS